MEKTRMYVLRGMEAEEPVLSSGYLARFCDLTISSVMLDDIMVAPDAPIPSQHFVHHEVRSLRDTRTLLSKNTLRDSIAFVEDKAHPRLWRLLAETALERLDLVVAEKSFVARSDYPGIQFVKRLRMLGDKVKQKAEVAASFARFDEAEAIYRAADRQDLAVELRMRIGDWNRVIQYLEQGGGDDELMSLARNRLGDYFADRKQWESAIPLYLAAGNFEALTEAYYIVEDYDNLIALIDKLREGSPLLLHIGQKLQSVGITEPAARALLKGGDFKAAVDVCVQLNQWDRAVELAGIHKLPQIEGLLHKYATKLLDEKHTIQAVELYRKANREADSARLLAKLASEVGMQRTHPLRAKQLFVLAALDVEAHRRNTLDLTANTGAANSIASMTRAGASVATTFAAGALATMMREDAASATTYGASTVVGSTSVADAQGLRIAAQTLDRAWHGAEAYHFLLITQRHLYSGDCASAMAAALRLTEYEDVLNPRDVHALIAVSAFYNRCLGLASRAFVKLENMATQSPEQRAAFADLALNIFSRQRPIDPLDDAATSVVCPVASCKAVIKVWSSKCNMCNAAFKVCTASGKPIFASGNSGPEIVTCKRCHHDSLKSCVKERKTCALCHAPFMST
jgi:WD repeat-containing protein 35